MCLTAGLFVVKVDCRIVGLFVIPSTYLGSSESSEGGSVATCYPMACIFPGTPWAEDSLSTDNWGILCVPICIYTVCNKRTNTWYVRGGREANLSKALIYLGVPTTFMVYNRATGYSCPVAMITKLCQVSCPGVPQQTHKATQAILNFQRKRIFHICQTLCEPLVPGSFHFQHGSSYVIFDDVLAKLGFLRLLW